MTGWIRLESTASFRQVLAGLPLLEDLELQSLGADRVMGNGLLGLTLSALRSVVSRSSSGKSGGSNSRNSSGRLGSSSGSSNGSSSGRFGGGGGGGSSSSGGSGKFGAHGGAGAAAMEGALACWPTLVAAAPCACCAQHCPGRCWLPRADGGVPAPPAAGVQEEEEAQEQRQWQPLPSVRRLRLDCLPGGKRLREVGEAGAQAYADWLAHLLPGLREVAGGEGTAGLWERVQAALLDE
jgi:hypothetical protein